MNSSDELNSVYFIKIPEGTLFSSSAMKIDPSIPLPVQRKEGETDIIEDVSKLSEEQILSGVLTVLAYDSKNANAGYYRDFIMTARPNIKKELSEAAILKTKNEDWDLAEEIWLSLRGLDPADRSVLLNTALFFDQKADSYRRNLLDDDADAYDDLALSYYKRAASGDDELPDAYFNLAFFYLKKQNFPEAKANFEYYLSSVADLSDEELGENGIYKKRRAQSLVDKISNRDLESDQFHKAYELIKDGRPEGLDEIRKFITTHPYVWNAWFLLGWGLRREGRFSDAKEAFLKAREYEGDDENADTLNELAICQMESGDLEEAKDTLIEALALDGDNTKVISNLGVLCLKVGKIDEAARYFKAVLEINPDDKIAQEQLARLKDRE